MTSRTASPAVLALCFACDASVFTSQTDGLFPSTPDTTESATCFNGGVCCPAGSAMRGADTRGDRPRLTCRAAGDPMQECFIDHSTRRSGIPACPDGTYARGLDIEARTLVCCYGQERGYAQFGAPESVESSICGSDSYVTGIDDDGEKLLCREPLHGDGVAALPGSGSSDPRPFNPTAEWKRTTRNWLARVLDIPVVTWLELTSGKDPRIPVAADPVELVCHAPLNGSRPCSTVPQCGRDECLVPQQHVRYASPIDGRKIYADLFFPPVNLTTAIPAERPVALITHGHPIGLGPEGKEATGNDPGGKYHAAARELAAVAQAITIAPDARTFGESAVPRERHAGAANGHDYGVLPPAYVLENIYNLGVALNATYGGYRADRSRVFVGGLSLGGWQAMYAGAIDPRVTGVIVAGAFVQTRQSQQACDTYFPGTCPHQHGASDRCMVLPGLSGDSSGDYSSRIILDTRELAALAAPARYLVTWGNSDANFGTLEQRLATDGARAAYAQLGASFSQVVFDAGHEWNTSASDAFVMQLN